MAAPPLVFVCYSRKDDATLQQLKSILEPFEQRGELRLWYDLKIAPGDTPDARIQAVIREASIALMLVSTPFLASGYIADRELPPILRAAHAGKLKAVPLFLEPTLVQHRSLLFTSENAREPFLLTYWQGLNQPDQPLATKDVERKQQLVAACTRLLDLVQSLPKAKPSSRSGRQPPPGDELRPEVTIQLMVQGRHIQRTFLGPAGRLAPPTTTDSPWLDRPPGHTLEADQLFEVLFGSAGDCTLLLQELLGNRTKITPVSRGGARVRIATDDPRLLLQPWHDTAWKHNVLTAAGWSFEYGAEPPLATSQNFEPVRLELPCAIAVAVADPNEQLHAKSHAEAMRTIGERAAPKNAQPAVAHDWQQLERCWLNRPEVFYLHCIVESGGGDLWLSFPGAAGGKRPLSDLARLWSHHRPHIAILNLVAAPPGDVQRAMLPLARLVPILILQSSGLAQVSHPELNARTGVERLLQALLHEDGIDPVRLAATHCLPSTAIWSRYSHFSRTRGSHEPWLSPRIDLDREDQRGQALDLCDKLVKDPESRTALLLAYGAAGNHLNDLGTQIESRIKETLHIKRIPCPLGRPEPTGASLSPHGLARDLHKHFGVATGTSLKLTLERARKEWFPSREIGIVLLDLGAHGGSHGDSLSAADIQELVTYLRQALPQDCPASVRLVALVTLEVATARFDDVAALAKRQGQIEPNQQFRLKALHPVKEIELADLLAYLQKRRSGCPKNLAARFAQAILTKSRGNFETACTAIDHAHQVGWTAAVLEELEQAVEPAPIPRIKESTDPL